ncbi:MAG: motility-associated protein [Opitutales bacterium]
MSSVVGILIVLGCTAGGFLLAGGKLAALFHLSEWILICGIAGGLSVIASPPSALKGTIGAVLGVLKGGGSSRKDFEEMLQLLFELFTIGRKNGLIALDEHMEDPAASSILSKYQTFVSNEHRTSFLINNLRPIIDAKIKPEQLPGLMKSDIHSLEEEYEKPITVMHLAAESLPAVGICAAVLGIIVTMGVLDQGAGKVGYKVAAALSGTFLGVYFAYGFVGPLCQRLHFANEVEVQYYKVLAACLEAFAKGMAPIMAVEMGRRLIEEEMKPSAAELEELVKGAK